jgi:hypothetical protein
MRNCTGSSNPSLRDWRRSLRKRASISHPPRQRFFLWSQGRESKVRAKVRFRLHRPDHGCGEQPVRQLPLSSMEPSSASGPCNGSTHSIRAQQTQDRELVSSLHMPLRTGPSIGQVARFLYRFVKGESEPFSKRIDFIRYLPVVSCQHTSTSRQSSSRRRGHVWRQCGRSILHGSKRVVAVSALTCQISSSYTQK